MSILRKSFKSERSLIGSISLEEYVGVDLTVLSGVVLHQAAIHATTSKLANPDNNSQQKNSHFHDDFANDFQNVKNVFHIRAFPSGLSLSKTADNNDTNSIWQPTCESVQHLTEIMKVYEMKSRGRMKCCCPSYRSTFLNMYEGMEQTADIYKEFALGGQFCSPFHINAVIGEKEHGSVTQNFRPYCGKCFELFCFGTYYHRVRVSVPNAPRIRRMSRISDDEQFEIKMSSGGFCLLNMLCADKCKAKHQIYDVINLNTGKIEGNIQRSSIKPNADIYAIIFPESASQEERLMLIISLIQIKFQP